MKEISIHKGETQIVYIYDKGKLIDKFEIKVNVNNYLCSNRVK
jgi:hypothetical protein